MKTVFGSRTFLAEAIGTGLLGAATVAVWFFFVDLISGTPFRTPGILGSAVFLGVPSPEQAEITLTTVGLYSVLHGAVIFMVGMGATAILRLADRTPSVLALLIQLVVVLQALFVGGVAILADSLLGQMAWWSVLGGNLLASLFMGALLLRRHPETAQRMRKLEALPTP